MDSFTANPTGNVTVKRNGKILGEYHPLQIGSLLETGHFQKGDLCLDRETSSWISIRAFLRKTRASRRRVKDIPDSPRGRRKRRAGRRIAQKLLLGFFALALASGAIFWSKKTGEEIDGLKVSLSGAEAASGVWKQKYENVLFAAREVASNDLVRGKVIIRDAGGKRIVLPGIKIRLYPRAEIEAFLSERYARIAEAGGTDPARLSTHFLKGIPSPIEVTTTDSDGRFECKVPEPGEYVIQTGIRSGKNGSMRIWFVAFDSRDPLNTPVDLTESNAVQQFNPLFMLVEGR